ncbi:MAG TPA: glucans biosynthesis glucosyltransferase MdoH [Longimicrobiales bacterium]|nr:glucans biosynthesis glucosyltransferase MdoH [Longimicrobiales bacterium]
MTGSPRIPWIRTRRAVFFGLVAATASGGAWMMARIVATGGVTLLEALILALFLPTFAWIVFPFWTAVLGFGLRLLRLDPLTLARRPGSGEVADAPRGGPEAALGSRTALAVPIYEEDPARVTARISAMLQSLLRTGQADAFDVHLLSDTRSPAVAAREEEAVEGLREAHPSARVHYRRRARNSGRKAGNLGEFFRRCRDDYDYAVVLDADSLMAGSTLVHRVRTMDGDPELGLVQTLPLPATPDTLFGRLVRFAATLYGPLLATGASFWQGDAGNYWGHNAILRLKPFADHVRLPVLPGRAPLGGEVLSHDFVEAAFLRRAGWKVVLDAGLGGSWEEVPGNLPEYAVRDRRWAQGSLQHLRLLGLPGLHPLSRLHLALGAMGYVSSLLWLLILLAGTAYVLLPWHGPRIAMGLPGARGSLLLLTAGILFLPKILALGLALLRDRSRYGGAIRLGGSVLLETTVSVVLAPVLMLHHARFVTQILAGRSVEWDARDRGAGRLSWSEAARSGAAATVVGAVWGGVTLALSPGFFLWMGPIFAGLLWSIPLLRWTSRSSEGSWTRRVGLLAVPLEIAPPPEVAALTAAEGIPAPDPSETSGVLVASGNPGMVRSPHRERRMYTAERGLFELRQGRPLLVTSGITPGALDGDVLFSAVEGVDDEDLRRLVELGSGPLRLVLTRHRIAAMGLESTGLGDSVALVLDEARDAGALLRLASGTAPDLNGAAWSPGPVHPAEHAALSLVRLGRILPALVSVPASTPSAALREALARHEVLHASVDEIEAYVTSAGAEVVKLSEAPVPLAEAEDSTFILFREATGLHEHVAILVGDQATWPVPVPVRLHSACLTGDLFGSLRCDCGEQLRGSMRYFAARGGGILLYLAQEGRGIGLRNKFRAYTLQEAGLDTIDADGALGFGADERRYDVAVRILERIGVRRIELLTNNPEKVRAMEEAGIQVEVRRPLHGTLNRHNLPYVRAKVKRAGHWLGDMLSQPLSGD